MTKLLLLGGVILCLSGCSRSNDYNVQVGQKDIGGEWVAVQVPRIAGNSNSLSKVKLILNLDGTARFDFLPLGKNDLGSGFRGGQWLSISGEGKWGLSDWGNGERQGWRVDLNTPAQSIQLLVRKAPADQIELIYMTDPDKEGESVIFRRK